MSTGVIIAIVVVAVLLIALLAFVYPRARRRAQVRAQERELNQRRESAVGEHREEAESREQRAEVAERRARIAQQEAERDRAEARLHEERAALHERGLADHELRGEGELPLAGGERDPGRAGGDGAAVDEQQNVGGRRVVPGDREVRSEER